MAMGGPSEQKPRRTFTTMNQDLKKLFGKTITGPDGELGRVKDFLFDTDPWVVRYLVVDTGSWLSERQVLLPPQALGTHGLGLATAGTKTLETDLTRAEIKDSPVLRSHHALSRVFEESYYAYFGWHPYWRGGHLWGDAERPRPTVRPIPAIRSSLLHDPADDVHLQSVRKVLGYHLQASDRALGELCSATIHGYSWVIRDWVVKAGPWYARKHIFLLPGDISRFSPSTGAVFVNLTSRDILQTRRETVVESGSVALFRAE